MDATRKKQFLTDDDWEEVFRIRKLVERGYQCQMWENRLCQRAWGEDEQRYQEVVDRAKEESTR